MFRKKAFNILDLKSRLVYYKNFNGTHDAYGTHTDKKVAKSVTSNDAGKRFCGKFRPLEVCSKSLVFDPRDSRAPIIKIPLRSCQSIKEVSKDSCQTENGNLDNGFIEVDSTMTVEMLEQGILQPYTFRRECGVHVFELVYLSSSAVLPQVCQLHRAASLPPNDQNTMIQAISRSRQHRTKFDRSLLGDVSETVVLETQASKVTPLVTNPGTVLITTTTLYFQPHNNVEQSPVIKIGLNEIRQVIKRRFLLRQVGLEVFCREQCSFQHLFVIFKETEKRNELYCAIIDQENLVMDDLHQDNVSYQWQAGAISNYEYLCYLNSQADRSVNDLTQYPVFPWVLADYISEELDLNDPGIYRDLSKPMGALNEERLSRLKERCRDMPEPRFLYGSHYSTPGFVLFYLVRQYPQYMLCLQNGRFDHPDRMFNSLQDTWHNVTTNPSDFKELIPDFYNTEGSAEFLVNSMGINFGVRQNGKPVEDVELPPWAKNPSDVIRVMREALESDYVSNNLHNWIDLIFGYKQRGQQAELYDNLYYHLCYEGAVDLKAITDLNERLALEVQITEFGQVPGQLFKVPHPKRCLSIGLHSSLMLSNTNTQNNNQKSLVESNCESNVGDNMLSTCEALWKNISSLQQISECRAHREAITALTFTDDSQLLITVGQDALLKTYTIPKLTQIRSVHVSSMAISSCLHLPGSHTILVGSWDNMIYSYDKEFSSCQRLLEAHSDVVSCMIFQDNKLITGSWDCTVRVWSLDRTSTSNAGIKSPLSPTRSAGGSIVCELDHDSPICSISVHSGGSLLASGTQDGVLTIWLLPEAELIHQITCGEGAINAIEWSSVDNRVITATDDGKLTIVDAHMGTKICVNNIKEGIRCLAWDGRLVLCGGVYGDLIIFDMGTGEIIKRICAHKGPLISLRISSNLKYVTTGGEDKKVLLWETKT
ncbi:unnamed protein product, partial [Meganyctiphanes norvegica]